MPEVTHEAEVVFKSKAHDLNIRCCASEASQRIRQHYTSPCFALFSCSRQFHSWFSHNT